MNNTLTAKEWLFETEPYFKKAGWNTNPNIDDEWVAKSMEKYANYKNRVLEDRIKEFRKELNLWWLFDADGKKITKDLLNEYDRHFNLK